MSKTMEDKLEKAYGGCRNCYGKGYSTSIISTSSRLGKRTTSEIVYCTCDRGKALKTLIDQEVKKARVIELRSLQSLRTNSKCLCCNAWFDTVGFRLAELEGNNDKKQSR